MRFLILWCLCLGAWAVDQKPLVINPTTGRTEQIQAANNLSVPGGLNVTGTVTLTVPLAATGGGTGFGAFTIGDIFYADSAGSLALLNAGGERNVLNIATGVPVWTPTLDVTGITSWDSLTFVVGNVDPTKRVKWEVDGQSALTTLTVDAGAQTADRTLTVQQLTADATVAVLEQPQLFTAAVHSGVFTLTDAATIATDATLGNTFTVTLAGNRTMGAPTNPVNCQRIIYRFTQDGTGTRTMAWNAAFVFSAGLPAPTLSTAAGAVDYVMFIYSGAAAKWHCVAYTLGF